jgi:ubiquitin-conjugating enzyme E2 Q
VPEESVTDFRPGTLDLASLPRLAPPSWATPTASRAIGRELQKLQQVQTATLLSELGWYINFEAVSNMFQWIVELHSFDASLPLAQDMKSASATSIVMEFRFGRDWPMSPPFVRAIRPRFMLYAHGGGGHVTAGGAMCMELLTNSGWSPANSMESVLLQVRMALCSEERGARLDLTPPGRRMTDYGVSEAVDAYIRAADVHGWEVPQDLRMTAYGGAEGSTG